MANPFFPTTVALLNRKRLPHLMSRLKRIFFHLNLPIHYCLVGQDLHVEFSCCFVVLMLCLSIKGFFCRCPKAKVRPTITGAQHAEGPPSAGQPRSRRVCQCPGGTKKGAAPESLPAATKPRKKRHPTAPARTAWPPATCTASQAAAQRRRTPRRCCNQG